MKNLDTILAAASPGDTITLDGGSYTTVGAHSSINNLPDNCTIIGNGSRIFLIDQGTTPVTALLGNTASIYGIILHCGFCPTGNINKRNGIYLLGPGSRVENCEVHGAYGNWSNLSECFALFAYLGSIIRCKVLDIDGDYVSAIWGRTVEDCVVLFPKQATATFRFYAAFNVGQTAGATVKNCYALNATYGVYHDWYQITNLRVQDNVFDNCNIGLNINCKVNTSGTFVRSADGVVFIGNTVYLNPTGSQCQAVLLDHTTLDSSPSAEGFIKNVTIQDNIVDFFPTETVTVPSNVRYFANVASNTAAVNRSPTLGITAVTIIGNNVAAAPAFIYRNKNSNAALTVTGLQSFSPTIVTT